MKSNTWPFPLTEPSPLTKSLRAKKIPSTYCNRIDSYIDDRLVFESVNVLVKTFPSPLPTRGPLGEPIHTKQDLLMLSTPFRYTEIFLPQSTHISATLSGNPIFFSRDEFLSWQLLRASAETLWILALKTDTHIQNLFEYDEALSADDLYDLDVLLREGPSDGPECDKCTNLISRLRENAPTEFCKLFIEAFCSPFTGFESYLETEIDGNVGQVSNRYSRWPCPLTIVSFGSFEICIEDGLIRMNRNKSSVYKQYVRNYDEKDSDLT